MSQIPDKTASEETQSGPSLRNDTLPQQEIKISHQAIYLVLTAAIFLLVGLLIATLIGGNDDTVGPDEVRNIVNEVVGTQMADLGSVSPGQDSSVNPEELQGMIDQSVSTQVAGLRPTATPVPLTPTRVPNTDAADDDAFKGPENAPVVLVEFSDFQCPYCNHFYADTLPQILERYPDQVKFVYRDFPIFGDDSIRAGMATECAEEQGNFWEMHDAIFDSRSEDTPLPLSQETLVGFAQELELNADAFTECLSSNRYMDEVTADYQSAVNYGFGGTPSFLINGMVIVGAQPFEAFDQAIQSALAAGLSSGN